VTLVRLNEDDVVDLITLAGTKLSEKQLGFVSNSDLHWAKLSCKVAEELDLDITRYWYMYGCYVDSDRATALRASQLRKKNCVPSGDKPSRSSVIDRAKSSDFKELYDNILGVVEKHLDIFRTRTDELRLYLYENEAPPRFRPLYLSNFYFTKLIENIYLGHRAFSDSYNELSDLTTQLHLSLVKSDCEKNCRMAVKQYSFILESIVGKAALAEEREEKEEATLRSQPYKPRAGVLACPQSPFDGFMGKYRRVLEEKYNYYEEIVWRYPASYIGSITVTGWKKEARNAKLLATVNDSTNFCAERIPVIKSGLKENGFLPSIEDRDRLLTRIVPEQEARADIADAYYHYLMTK